MREVKIFPAEIGVAGWLETSPFVRHQFNDPQKDLLDEYDYVVVGGGYGGLGAAVRFAELHPKAKIAVFEAIRIGANDSGKNMGFLIDVPHLWGNDVSTLEDKKWQVKLNLATIDKMRTIIKNNNLKVDWDECGKYLAAHEPSAFKYLDMEARLLDTLDVEYQFMEHDELTRRLGTRYYNKALFNAGTVLINPADVLRGIFSTLPDTVHVFEKTPVLRIENGSEPVVVLSKGQRITCKAVITHLGPFLKEFGLEKNICQVLSFAGMTRPLTEKELKDFKDVRAWGNTSGHPAGTTVRFTTDKRLIVRNGFKYATWYSCSPDRVRRSQHLLRKAFNKRFPKLTHVNFEYVWGGLIHMTMNSKPIFGRQGNIFYSGTGEGAAVAKAFTLGTYHAEWASGRQSDVLEYLRNDVKPNWVPPEPLVTVGAESRIVWESFRAKGEI